MLDLIGVSSFGIFAMSLKRSRSASPQPVPHISTSPIIEDRSSKFLALYSPTLSPKELQSHPSIKGATHRITAWRKPSPQQSLTSKPSSIDSGHDDDGEKYGGKTIAKVMDAMDNIHGTVVVARWYGGVMLGPVRFEHIRGCARAAISKWLGENQESSKRQRLLQAEGEERARLERVLRERDESIGVLRALLKGKRKPGALEQQRTGGETAKAIDYKKMPLSVLRRLEDVRDATIGWIIRGIEEVEKDGEAGETSKAEGEVDGEEARVLSSGSNS